MLFMVGVKLTNSALQKQCKTVYMGELLIKLALVLLVLIKHLSHGKSSSITPPSTTRQFQVQMYFKPRVFFQTFFFLYRKKFAFEL